MDITVQSFAQNVLSPCFGPAKPKAKEEQHPTSEESRALRTWETKNGMFEYNATVVIADSALVATVASVALAVFGAIGPLFALALFATAGIAYFNAVSSLKDADPAYHFIDFSKNGDETGLHHSDFEKWNKTCFNVCNLIALFNLLPTAKKPEVVKG